MKRLNFNLDCCLIGRNLLRDYLRMLTIEKVSRPIEHICQSCGSVRSFRKIFHNGKRVSVNKDKPVWKLYTRPGMPVGVGKEVQFGLENQR